MRAALTYAAVFLGGIVMSLVVGVGMVVTSLLVCLRSVTCQNRENERVLREAAKPWIARTTSEFHLSSTIVFSWGGRAGPRGAVVAH
jgi:hypothetical protein